MRRKYPKQPVMSVGAVIIEKGKVLLIRRAAPPGKGLWAVPGGTVKLGEKLVDAVKREVKEETGLEIEVGKLIDLVEVLTKDEKGRIEYHYVIADYEAKVIGGKLKASSDALEVKWFNLNEIDKIEATKSTKKILKKILEESKFKHK